MTKSPGSAATSDDAFDIQLLSDLHLEVERDSDELYRYDFPASAPNLALLGDIGWTRDVRLFEWLEIQLSRFRRVFFIAGNHEPYGSTLEESTSALEAFANRVSIAHANNSAKGEFILLNRTRYDISPSLTILGCTLWSALNPEDLEILSWSLTDFKRVYSFTPDAYKSVHEADLAWLTASIAKRRVGGRWWYSRIMRRLWMGLETQNTSGDRRIAHLRRS
ncbi:hypothetical protein Hypma_010882 [Hypsizygus marmoreus]|uniref:Calcineurin-like phosphoesterase domain-containing protein n=1 Tax=Hypsizygus marmoreus TaxID=39966 RepID=A0A369JKI6_HYPMA|nr:hypothetical protein Hypma_010882 [Hypsizygus marmoreus]